MCEYKREISPVLGLIESIMGVGSMLRVSVVCVVLMGWGARAGLGAARTCETLLQHQQVTRSLGNQDVSQVYPWGRVWKLLLTSLAGLLESPLISLLDNPHGRDSKIRRYVLPLLLALQVKLLLSLPLVLLLPLLLGLKSIGTSLLAALFSGASLLRSLVPPRGGGGSSSRVSYEVRPGSAGQQGVQQAGLTYALQPQQDFQQQQLQYAAPPQPYFIPAGTELTGVRAPEYRILSAASNEP